MRLPGTGFTEGLPTSRASRVRVTGAKLALPWLAIVLTFLALPSAAPCQEGRPAVTAAERASLIDSIAVLLETRFVLIERAAAFADSLRARQASGAYDRLTSPAAFAEAVTADLREITGDAHCLMRVIESSDVGEEVQSALHHPVRYFRLGQREHLGFTKLEWLEGHIGYLDLRRFYPISESRDMVDGTMRFLAGADAVIIDLRENGGGAGEGLVYWSRYFLPPSTQLTSYYARESEFLTEFWTVREVGGPLLQDVPLFLLTGERTFSAAEMFAYDLQVYGRATLVGGVTGGGGSSVDLYLLGDGFEIYLSSERAINPVTGTGWEGVGVVPDVLVPTESALDTALVLARAAARDYGAARDVELASAVERMERALTRAEDAYRGGRDVAGAAALNDMLNAGAPYGLVNEFFLFVLAYEYYRDPADAGLLLAILHKRVELFPRSVEAHEALGQTLADMGETELARRQFRAALEIDPENRNVAKRLRALEGGREER